MFDDELLVALEISAYLLLVWWSVRRSRNRNDWLFLLFLVGAFSLAAGHMAKFAQTVLTMHPAMARSSWYYVPAYLTMALIVPLRCFVALYFIRRFVGPKWPRSTRVLSLGIVLCGAVLLITKTDFGHPFRYVDQASSSSKREWEITSYLGTRIMNRVPPEDSVVGSWNAGAIGYFSRLPVVNLDGLANSHDYQRAKMADDTRSFLPSSKQTTPFHRKFGLTHFADAGQVIDWGRDGIVFEGASFHISTIMGEVLDRAFYLWSAKPARTSDRFDGGVWFWERMQDHFHYELSDVAVVFDGVFAQVFARECKPARVRNVVFAFFWVDTDGATVGSRYQWENPRRNRFGLCVDAFELPNEAVAPFRVDVSPASEQLEPSS